jgi:hypothetical protein
LDRANTLSRPLAVAALLLATLAALPTYGGRPLSTEDASVLEEGRCQLETWIDRSRDATVGWFVPACNVGASIEWQVGGAGTWAGGSHRFSEAYAQAKTVFTAEDAPWGVGLVAGVARRPLQEAHRGWVNPYVIVPVTIAIGEGALHLNAGWAHDRLEDRDVTLWGIAGEWPAGERLTLVAEAFGENSERPFLRAGGRWSVAKDVFDVDLTVVAKPGGTRDERFVSLGVFWQSDRFLK